MTINRNRFAYYQSALLALASLRTGYPSMGQNGCCF